VLEDHSSSVSSVAFSHDSTLVASASDDYEVRLWCTDTGEYVQELKGHSNWVYSVAFSHDSTLVASASEDNTVRLWRTDTGGCVQEVDVGVTVFQLSFESGDSQLLTEIGAIAIDKLLSLEVGMTSIGRTGSAAASGAQAVPRPDAAYRFGYGFNRDRNWVTWCGENLLWLPAEFRPPCSAVSGATVVIGCSSGRVIIIRFSTKDLPKLLTA
jgi:WD40 repeat protein